MSSSPFETWSPAQRVSSNTALGAFGALPFQNPPEASVLVPFTMPEPNPSAANCDVVGPNNKLQFRVVTDAATPGYTVLKAANDESLATIEWREPTKLEVRGLIPKQRAADFFKSSCDRRYRAMAIQSREYVLVSTGGTLLLYTAGTKSYEFLARTSKRAGSCLAELTRGAVSANLLQVCIVTILLLQNGRKFN
ncbi:hypothetical protein DFH05DRAFT_1405172 [Lentinula detonsa]|uniref:Uncharacterized protein n=1 Tax=Lentinula detonsa TaxID=2804962 RepID=A0A9W8TU78_9AGAR|nr:hypothetical protein DFH05DRAFT_1405172 [Lentinula detonsa]